MNKSKAQTVPAKTQAPPPAPKTSWKDRLSEGDYQ